MTDTVERPTTKARATSSALTARQVASLRSHLEDDRARTGVLIDTVGDEMDAFVSARRGATSTNDGEDPEGPTLAFESAQSSAILGSSRQHLAEIDAALLRMDEGRYGLCRTCGKDIALGRLQVRPQAALCISCAERAR